MKKHPVSRPSSKKEKGFFVSVLVGAVCSIALGMILLALSCIPALAMEDPLRYAPVFALISLFVSDIVGARVAARLHGKSGLACGMLSSLALILTAVALCFVFSLQIRTPLFMICAPALLLAAAVSGIGGVSHREPKSKKHKPKGFR